MRVTQLLASGAVVLALVGCAEAAEPGAESPIESATATPSPTPTPTPTVAPDTGLPDPSNFEAMDPALFAVNQFVDPVWGAWDYVDVNFGSPSGNLGCGILGPEHQGGLWGCAIDEKSWEFPRDSPDDFCYDAQVSCGRGIEVTGLDVPHPRLRSDPGFPGAFAISSPDSGIRTLEYGQSVTFNNVTCFSEETGVTCVNSVSGHGFVISRDTNEIF